MNIIKKVSYIFSKKQKIQSACLMFGLFTGALFELVGVSFITQLVSLVTNPKSIHESEMMSRVYDTLHMQSDREFILCVVIGLIIVYFIKNAYLFTIIS